MGGGNERTRVWASNVIPRESQRTSPPQKKTYIGVGSVTDRGDARLGVTAPRQHPIITQSGSSVWEDLYEDVCLRSGWLPGLETWNGGHFVHRCCCCCCRCSCCCSKTFCPHTGLPPPMTYSMAPRTREWCTDTETGK